ncbi:MAG: hypothetical protein AABZ32_07145, partial [Bacteroidota bacterium]
LFLEGMYRRLKGEGMRWINGNRKGQAPLNESFFLFYLFSLIYTAIYSSQFPTKILLSDLELILGSSIFFLYGFGVLFSTATLASLFRKFHFADSQGKEGFNFVPRFCKLKVLAWKQNCTDRDTLATYFPKEFSPLFVNMN